MEKHFFRWGVWVGLATVVYEVFVDGLAHAGVLVLGVGLMVVWAGSMIDHHRKNQE